MLTDARSNKNKPSSLSFQYTSVGANQNNQGSKAYGQLTGTFGASIAAGVALRESRVNNATLTSLSGVPVSGAEVVLRWSLDRGKMYAARENIEGPRRRWLYILSLLVVVLAALGISAMATFTASDLIQNLELTDLITGGNPDAGGFATPENQSPWQEIFRDRVGRFDEGMTLRGAADYQDISRKHMPRDNH